MVEKHTHPHHPHHHHNVLDRNRARVHSFSTRWCVDLDAHQPIICYYRSKIRDSIIVVADQEQKKKKEDRAPILSAFQTIR